MKKIKDERLILNNLRNIRIAFIVQTLGILSILGYNLYEAGARKMFENPLWLVLMLTMIIYLYLTMSVSVDIEQRKRNPKTSFLISVIILIATGVGVAFLVSLTPHSNWLEGLLVGGVLIVCGLIPASYVYHLRKKQTKELEDE